MDKPVVLLCQSNAVLKLINLLHNQSLPDTPSCKEVRKQLYAKAEELLEVAIVYGELIEEEPTDLIMEILNDIRKEASLSTSPDVDSLKLIGGTSILLEIPHALTNKLDP